MGMKIAPPTLGETRPGSELTERARRALLLRDSVEGLAFARDALEDVEGERLDISQCRFTRCRIAPGRIKWLSFTDCGFENCDFSGALLRSADALCAEAVILTNSVCDIFNPAVVRASQGALFSVKVAEATPAEAAEWLKARGIKTFGAHLGASDFLWNADMSVPCAIVVGSEKDGLGDDWNGLLDCRVKIPMGGISDSMNVNVAAALFLYEALRSKSAL